MENLAAAAVAMIPWLRPVQPWPEKVLLTPEQAAEMKEHPHA